MMTSLVLSKVALITSKDQTSGAPKQDATLGPKIYLHSKYKNFSYCGYIHYHYIFIWKVLLQTKTHRF